MSAGQWRGRLRGWWWKLPLLFVVFSVLQVLTLRFADPIGSPFMLARWVDAFRGQRLRSTRRHYPIRTREQNRACLDKKGRMMIGLEGDQWLRAGFLEGWLGMAVGARKAVRWADGRGSGFRPPDTIPWTPLVWWRESAWKDGVVSRTACWAALASSSYWRLPFRKRGTPHAFDV